MWRCVELGSMNTIFRSASFIGGLSPTMRWCADGFAQTVTPGPDGCQTAGSAGSSAAPDVGGLRASEPRMLDFVLDRSRSQPLACPGQNSDAEGGDPVAKKKAA